MKLRFIPHLLRPLVAPFLAEVRSLEARKALIARKLGNLLHQREQNSQGRDEKPSVHRDDEDDVGGELLDWFRAQYTTHKPSVRELTRDQLLATFASIYNLTNALTYILFDLAAYPDFVEELRAELRDVLGDEGTIDKTSIMQLRKLDSFVRESQRLRPTSLGK